jgi:hypothetical protein
MRLLELIESPDGKLDEQSVLSIILVLTFCFLTVHAQLTNTPFDAQGFGIGSGAVMGATLAGMGFRARKDGP